MTSGPPVRDPVADALSADLARQLKALAVSPGAALDGRAAIYLDTCYWIHLREAQRGRGDPCAAKLLARLREAVQAGRAICPISESTEAEVLRA